MNVLLLLTGILLLAECILGVVPSRGRGCHLPLQCYPYTNISITRSICEADGCQFCESARLGQKCRRDSCPAGMELRYDKKSCCRLSSSPRIVGGTPSKRGQWPWLVSITIFNFAADLLQVCGGFFVDNSHIVSAAHCYSAGAVFIVGYGGTTVPEMTYFAVEEANITVHPDFKRPNLAPINDIMLLSFPPITENTDKFAPISLPNGEHPPNGLTCFVAGWGLTALNGTASPALLEIAVDIKPFPVCKIDYENYPARKAHICAGVSSGHKAICPGDSGGPLVCQRCSNCDWYVAGIASFTYECGKNNIPDVYTRVSSFQKWLHENGVVRSNRAYTCRTR